MITQEYLKSILIYDNITGTFKWIRQTNPKARAIIGGQFGCINSAGYLIGQINNKIYGVHRLAWLYTYGEWPKVIDHINGVRTDNRIENLRNTDKIGNGQNKNSHRLGRLLGTQKYENKYKSVLYFNSRRNYLGTYDTEIEAHETYNQVKYLLERL